MRRRRSHKTYWSTICTQSNTFLLPCSFLLAIYMLLDCNLTIAGGCPPSEAIMPCRCSLRGKEIQIWCTHSNLPQIIEGINAVDRNIKSPIDEFVLENNHLPALPGRFFGSLQILRLMLRYNGIERVSNGWLNELENSLMEIYVVEPQLRSIPTESLTAMINMIAITIQSDELKHLPDFSGLLSLTYLSVQSGSLNELQPYWLRHLPKLQDIHINGGSNLNRLEAGVLNELRALKSLDLSRNGINWIHLRSLNQLPNLTSLKLSYNQISDVGMIGRIIKDLESLKRLRLDHNIINIIEGGSFVDLPFLAELHLNDNRITEIQYGAFLHTPMLKSLYLHNNHIRRIHPESFLQSSGSGIEIVFMYGNEIDQVSELRSLLVALPTLKFLDVSNNYLAEIKYGELRGHSTLEQLHLNNNLLRIIERDALMAMPALRELRMRNNSLSEKLPMPFWNLPSLKGLDLSANQFRTVDSHLLSGLPSLRRLDLCENGLSIIDPTTFIHNPMLETLNISSNELDSIHPATFRKLDRLFEIDASYNQLREILSGLPKVVERVLLRGNLIASLPAASSRSKSLNLPNLRMLDLSFNHLEQLPKFSFRGVPQLRVLHLANNRLRTLDDTAFIGAQNMELLQLQENEISQIDERAFLPLSELRNLNLQSNKLEAITDNLFSNNTRLEKLDLSRNHIHFISPVAFEVQHSLEYLDLSGNMLADISISLAELNNLRDIDLSYNKISRVHADVVSAWRNVVEIRLANNLIVELKQGTFANLPKLQYLDLSSNEISSLEPSSLKNLPDLQEFVLADNKLVELKDYVFEDLPNLLASHFQYNMLRYISPESFYNSPSMVFLNLSNNNFQNMENIGLRGMRNLEVLDLSNNKVRMIPTMPLKALNWLVELKMDRNQICKIKGAPFETMPRLRVLSMRNNRLRTIQERTFRNLRGNIAILDVDENPIQCSCEMQWLSVWLHETNSPYPGPKCNNGHFLRNTRMDKTLCSDANKRTSSSAGSSTSTNHHDDDASNNHLPLFNEHGDSFQRELQDDLNDECDFNNLQPGERPYPSESEYFYDQYVDYTPPGNGNQTNESTSSSSSFSSSSSSNNSSGIKLYQSPTIDLNHTILNTNYFKNRPLQDPSAQSSPFTFFGYPIPNLNLGRFFGSTLSGRNNRGNSARSSMGRSNTLSNTSSASSEQLPATHRMREEESRRSGGGGGGGLQRPKFRKYQPNSAEFEKYLNDEKKRTAVAAAAAVAATATSTADEYNRDTTARVHYIDGDTSDSVETTSQHDVPHTPSVFRTTAFQAPANIERGGFRPIALEHMIVGGFMPLPGRRVEATTQQISSTELNYVPVRTASRPPPPPNHKSTVSSVHQRQRESKTPYNNTTLAPASTTTVQTTESTGISSPHITTAIPSTTPLPRPTTTNLPVTVAITTFLPPPQNPSSRLSDAVEITTENNFYNDEDDDDEESVGLLKPPPYVPTTTAETILLIPPSEEHIAQIKRNFWATAPKLDDHKISSKTSGNVRSTVTKVHTPQTLNHFLPSAEEYHYGPTTTLSPPHVRNQYESDDFDLDAANDNQRLHQADAQQRVFLPAEFGEEQLHNNVDRKDSTMDWYYESFKKPQQHQRGETKSSNAKPPTSNYENRLSSGGGGAHSTPIHFTVPYLLLLTLLL